VVDGDVLIGGDGNDTLMGRTGMDRIVGDNAEVYASSWQYHGLDGFADNGKREYYKNDFDGLNPYRSRVCKAHLRNRRCKDVIEAGVGDDWAVGRSDDDTYVSAGGQPWH